VHVCEADHAKLEGKFAEPDNQEPPVGPDARENVQLSELFLGAVSLTERIACLLVSSGRCTQNTAVYHVGQRHEHKGLEKEGLVGYTVWVCHIILIEVILDSKHGWACVEKHKEHHELVEGLT